LVFNINQQLITNNQQPIDKIMSLDFDPIYHTVTMVKILRDQGSTQFAMELAQEILKTTPNNQSVAAILEELKEEAKKTFERFKNSGRSFEASVTTSSQEEDLIEVSQHVEQQEILEVSFPSTTEEREEIVEEPVNLTLVQGGKDDTRVKVSRLQGLLKRIQGRKIAHEASQA
jgi:hypothetical protein